MIKNKTNQNHPIENDEISNSIFPFHSSIETLQVILIVRKQKN